MNRPKLHIAIPALNEAEYLPQTIACLKNQSIENFHTWVCVNQPDDWWDIKEKNNICSNNAVTLQYLDSEKPLFSNLTIIDKSSKGKGWQGKSFGVGFARKTLMDAICENADDNDIIVSMDADIEFGSNYLSSVAELFANNNKAVALANPYYHKLSGNEDIDRLMLRYEIYMRSYTINLLRINSPYAFTAFGSVISLPAWAYKKIRGITPKTSGEDFYLLQKLRKMGDIILHNDEIVFPATRVSDRVPYGTGPAISMSLETQQSSYPIFHPKYFNEILETYSLFSDLYIKDVKTPLSDFFKFIFKTEDIFSPLRQNYKTLKGFVNACHSKVDGLRVFQYLKWRNNQDNYNEYLSLKTLLDEAEIEKSFNFATSSVQKINRFRDFLFNVESELRRKNFSGMNL
jgi:glycosyltransferase involved in cell wall biosynthesis